MPEEKLDVTKIVISDHVIEQFKRRSGSRKTNATIKKKLVGFLEGAKKVKTVENYGAVQLLNHNLVPADYYQYGSWILVVSEGVLKTIHENEAKRWK